MDTAFRVRAGAGTGPRVAILAEYDALPEIGHACGHNLIAAGAVGAFLAAAAGSPIHAAAPGQVVFSGVMPGYGNLIEVDHGGGWETRYAHNSKNLVNVGDQVDAGRQIGLVGRTGRASGDHLHFEARRDGRAADPKIFLAATAKGRRHSSKV